MQKFETRMIPLGAVLVAVSLVAAGSAAAQSEPETQPQGPPATRNQGQLQEQAPAEEAPAVPARASVPRVTGTVTRWTGHRIDLKTPDGKTQKVAVNRNTERLVDIKEGLEVTVEYRRKVSGFVIATRVLAAGTEAEEPEEAPGSNLSNESEGARRMNVES